ncbi:MAG: hypothetical protein UU21_C0001G0066 [Candidatus Levybacteria bacterium GW2011_GWA2_40_8]|nr:MAG: hypothetical protein UU21_C0001G0066 [Candidatus Levybacteria bacterium GW2011_GWA2_40_8]
MPRFLEKLIKSSQKGHVSRQAGFTLIELLVVIAILGVLAAALIATIDPFEQIKKANDANAKNTAAEFVNANIRYYATHNALPWADPSATSTCTSGGTTVSTLALTNTRVMACMGILVSENELKPGFTTVTQVLKNITASGNAGGVTACFKPESKSGTSDPNTKYTIAGVSGCTTGCYWCAQ